MDYHLFKKPRKIKNKTVHRWYYYYVDPFTGKEIQKACRGCKTQAEANRTFRKLEEQLYHCCL